MATLLSIPSLLPVPVHSPVEEPAHRLRDRFGRAITDLRVSVTDRCNYRCVYCRTGEYGTGMHELPIAEYSRMVRLLVSLGIEKVRLTGGEPLLRAGILDLLRGPAYPASGLSCGWTLPPTTALHLTWH